MSEKKTIEVLLKLNDQMGAQIGARTTDMLEAAAAADKLTRAIARTSEEQNDAAKSAIKLSNAHATAAKKTKEHTESTAGIARSMVGMAAAYVSIHSVISAYSNAMKFVIETGSEFQQSMANTKAILQPTAEEFQALSYYAQELGRNTMFSAKQAADMETELGKAGFNTAQILASGSSVLDLAAASNMGLAESATIASATVKQFNLTAGDTQKVVDVLAKTVSISAADAKDYGDAMSYVGVAAENSGYNLEETSAAIGVLSDKMIKGERAGTGLRKIVGVLADSSSEASKAIAKVNPNATTLAEKFEALKSTGFDSTKAIKLFGLEAYTASLALVGGVEDLKRYGEELQWTEGKAKGFAKAVADIQADTLQGDLKLAESAAQGLGIVLAEAFGDSTRNSVQRVTEALGELTEWADENPAKLREWGNAAEDIFSGVLAGAKLLAGGIETINDVISFLNPFDMEDTFTSDVAALVAETDKIGQAYIEVEKHAANATKLTNAFNKSSVVSNMFGGKSLLKEASDERALVDEAQRTIVESENKRDSILKEQIARQKELSALRKEILSPSEKKELDTLNQVIPAVRYADQNNISFRAASQILAKEEVERQKALASKMKFEKEKLAEEEAAAKEQTELTKKQLEERARLEKEANESFKKILREREVNELTGWQRELQERENYWNEKIEIDKAGGAKHTAQLEKFRDDEIAALLKPGEQTYFGNFQGRSAAPDAQISASENTGLEAAYAASGVVKNEIWQKENQDRMKLAEESRIELENANKSELELEEEKYQRKLELFKMYGEETEALTKAHEENVAQIQQKVWETHLTAAATFFGGFAQLAAVAASKNKEWAIAAKALAISEAIMNTAVGVTKAYAMGGPLGFITGAGVIAAGTAQIATISQQKFAQGQYSTSASFGVVAPSRSSGIVPYAGGSYSGDKVLAGLNPGERVLTVGQNRDYESRSSGTNVFNYSPTYNRETTALERRKDVRYFQKQMRAANSDPSFTRVQAAYV